MPKISIVLPSYNESENIKILIPQIKRGFPKAEILVVDDNSPDKTAKIAKNLGARVLVRNKKEGIGTALIEGYNAAKGDIIVSMDADCSIAVKDIHRLLEELRENDIVTGSKYSKRSKVEGFSTKMQEILSRFGNKFFVFFFNLPVDDVTLNFRAFRRETWRRFNLKEKTNVALLEMLVDAKRKKMKIGQIPIHFAKRNYGQSKMNLARLILLYFKYLMRAIFG